MKIKIDDNNYILHKNAIDAIILEFEKIEQKRIKLIEKNRISSDFPSIKVDFKNIEEDVKKTVLTSSLSATKKQIFKHGIKDNSYYQVTIDSSILPLLNDWRVLGSIDKNIETNSYTLKSYNEKENPIPNQYKNSADIDPCNCDHCGHNRKRNSTFIIKNEKSDEVIQVGSSCMEDFTDKSTMEMLLLYSKSLNILRDFDEENISIKNGVKTHFMLDKLEFIATTNAVMEASGGFITKKNANLKYSKLPTYKATLNVINDYSFQSTINNMNNFSHMYDDGYSETEIDNYSNFIKSIKVTEDDYKKAEEVIEWYRERPPKNEDDERYFNTHSILTNESAILFDKESSTVCYAIQSIHNLELKAKQDAENEFKEKHKLDIPPLLEDDKVKIENIELKLIKAKYGDNDFGDYIKYDFEARDGRKFKWTASNSSFPESLMESIKELPENIGFDIESRFYSGDIITNFVEKNQLENKEIWLELKGTSQVNRYKNFKNETVEENKLTRVKSTKDRITDKPVTEGIIETNDKFFVDQFKVLSIKEGLSPSTKEKHYEYEIESKSGVKNKYRTFNKADINEGDFFQANTQNIGSEIAGLSHTNITKIPEFTEDFERHLYKKPRKKRNPKLK